EEEEEGGGVLGVSLGCSWGCQAQDGGGRAARRLPGGRGQREALQAGGAAGGGKCPSVPPPPGSIPTQPRPRAHHGDGETEAGGGALWWWGAPNARILLLSSPPPPGVSGWGLSGATAPPQGAFGRCYRLSEVGSGRGYAAKVIPRARLKDPGVAERSLADILRARGVLTEPEARYYLRQGGEGLRYLHGQGLVHRDLKPSAWGWG
uniref:Protein kinase domain-containing protein n=1 Tax=Anas platyrhynchos TaxID=8839 RepID=A0A8B9SWQ1_ANAPL